MQPAGKVSAKAQRDSEGPEEPSRESQGQRGVGQLCGVLEAFTSLSEEAPQRARSRGSIGSDFCVTESLRYCVGNRQQGQESKWRGPCRDPSSRWWGLGWQQRRQ